jgi:putative tricarboxylic transport membrane protein
MIICSIAIFWRSRNSAEGGRAPALTIDPAFRERTRLVSFLLVPGAILAYLMLSEWLGFIPSAFGILLGMMLWFGVRALTALIVALVMTGLLHWFFGTLMRVPLPRGLFMQIVAGG